MESVATTRRYRRRLKRLYVTFVPDRSTFPCILLFPSLLGLTVSGLCFISPALRLSQRSLRPWLFSTIKIVRLRVSSDELHSRDRNVTQVRNEERKNWMKREENATASTRAKKNRKEESRFGTKRQQPSIIFLLIRALTDCTASR